MKCGPYKQVVLHRPGIYKFKNMENNTTGDVCNMWPLDSRLSLYTGSIPKGFHCTHKDQNEKSPFHPHGVDAESFVIQQADWPSVSFL